VEAARRLETKGRSGELTDVEPMCDELEAELARLLAALDAPEGAGV
jgi:hypothetical protein